MKINQPNGIKRKYNGRTIEEWFHAIRNCEVNSPDAITAFRNNKLGSEGRQSIPFLIECLSDVKIYGDFDLRYVAMYALGRLKALAIPALDKLQLIASNRELAYNYAYEACLYIGPKDCGLSFWLDALKSEDDFVVRTAAEALGKFGKDGAQAVGPLIKAALDNNKFDVPQNFSECLSALIKISPNNPDVLALARHVLNKIDVYEGIRAISEIDTPESIIIMTEIIGVARPEMKGLYGNKIILLLNKYTKKHTYFKFKCHKCKGELSINFLCDHCK